MLQNYVVHSNTLQYTVTVAAAAVTTTPVLSQKQHSVPRRTQTHYNIT